MRQFLNNLTVNQMVALLVGVILIVMVAAVLFSISQQEEDPFAPTATPPFVGTMMSFDPRTATAQAATDQAP